MPILLAISVQKPQLAGYLSTGKRSNFLYVEAPTAWLYNCPQVPPTVYEADKCFDRIPKNYQDTVILFDPTARQTFEFATLKIINRTSYN